MRALLRRDLLFRGAGAAAGPRRLSARTLPAGPGLQDFLGDAAESQAQAQAADQFSQPMARAAPGTSVYIETYGCQMNVTDSDIVRAVLEGAGYSRSSSEDEANVVLINTCAIRDNAEARVWTRLRELRGRKLKRAKAARPVIGVLGCMAERLKTRLLEEDQLVDLVAGPDAYRDLPRLVELVQAGESAINVQLSQDETYADIAPVRVSQNDVTAFVSIARGCNNVCTYCVVPFTRGRERSRPMPSIVGEVRRLVEEQGVKEVTLLGQNVNTYHDKSSQPVTTSGSYVTAKGFGNVFKGKSRDATGARFADLVAAVSDVSPELRVRFTSPHPKDFPDELLQLIAERDNVCKQLHMPAQSGSSAVLKSMRREYTREAYDDLVQRARQLVPGVAISSDFIAGFCGETEEDHEQSVSLIKETGYAQAFLFAYSMRERTHAAYKLVDDVPEEVKLRRLRELIDAYRGGLDAVNAPDIGQTHSVLVEGSSRKSRPDAPQWTGRNDANKRVVFTPAAGGLPTPGQYVDVLVEASRGQTLWGSQA